MVGVKPISKFYPNYERQVLKKLSVFISSMTKILTKLIIGLHKTMIFISNNQAVFKVSYRYPWLQVTLRNYQVGLRDCVHLSYQFSQIDVFFSEASTRD